MGVFNLLGCACAASCHAATTPPTGVMNSRRLYSALPDLLNPLRGQSRHFDRAPATSGLPRSAGVIGRSSLWIAEDFWVLRFRPLVKRGPWLRPQASEGEAQHGPFWWIGRIGQGDQHLHCG